MRRVVSLLLSLISIRAAAREHHSAFGAVQSLSLRGGALDPTTTAKAGAALWGATGLIAHVKPQDAMDMLYGVPPSKLANFLMRRVACSFFLFGVASWCMLHQNMGLVETTGYTSLVWLGEFVRTVVWNDAKSVGLKSNRGTHVVTALYLYITWATLTKANNSADFAVRLNAVFCAAAGVFMMFQPAGWIAMCCRCKADDSSLFILRTLGAYLLAAGIFFGLQIFGNATSPTRAFGYVWVVSLLQSATTNWITKEVEKFSMDKRPQYYWMLVQAAFIGTILFSGGDAMAFASSETTL